MQALPPPHLQSPAGGSPVQASALSPQAAPVVPHWHAPVTQLFAFAPVHAEPPPHVQVPPG